VRENTRWDRSSLEEPAACSGSGDLCGAACPLREIEENQNLGEK